MSQVSNVVSEKNKLLTHQISYLIQSLAGREQELELASIDLRAGETLIEQDATDNNIYLVCSGSLGVRKRMPDGNIKDIGEVGTHSVVGELAMLGGQKRSATIYALDDATLISATREQIETLFSEKVSAFEELKGMATSRWQNLNLIGILGEIFGDLDYETWKDLQQHFEWQPLASGETLFLQGDSPDGMYIVVNGRLRVEVTDDNANTTVKGEAGPSEIIGEYALLTNEPRSASVYAVRETNVVKLSSSMFEELVQSHPELMRRIALLLVQRQKKNDQSSIGDPPLSMTFTLLPTSANIDLLPFANELAQSLAPYGEALVLNAERFDEFFGHVSAAECPLGAAIQPLIVAKLDELETDYRYVIFLADDTYSNWTKRAVGQADRLFIVSRGNDDPALSTLEKSVIDSGCRIRTELVLMHDAEVQMPSNTAAWMDQRTIRNHYHVRDGEKPHIDRMARRMSGHAIALVMGGGAAKGYAELGFYKAMLEADIPYDYVGGASMGAIMGGQIALESDYEEFEKNAQWTADIGVIDRTLPLVAMTSSNNVRKINQHGCGETLIEDLWCPFFCVSTSLSTSSVRVHQRGSMWRAIRASMSIPGIFVPVVEDGDVLVDGGIMDNFPVATMQKLAESNRIIGVDVVPYRERRRFYDIDTCVSGWRVLLNKINPFSKNLKTPSLVEILMRTLEVNANSSSREQAHLTDLLIQPDTRGYGPDAYDKWKPLAERGYEASIEKLVEWKSRQTL